MRTRYKVSFVGLIFCSALAVAQPALPPSVQADLLATEIEGAMAAGNAKEALEKIAEYRKLGVKVPPILLFTEGRLANLTKDYARAKGAFMEYLAIPDIKNDKNYGAALSAYSSNEKAYAADLAAKEAAMTPEQRAQREADLKATKLSAEKAERCTNAKANVSQGRDYLEMRGTNAFGRQQARNMIDYGLRRIEENC